MNVKNTVFSLMFYKYNYPVIAVLFLKKLNGISTFKFQLAANRQLTTFSFFK